MKRNYPDWVELWPCLLRQATECIRNTQKLSLTSNEIISCCATSVILSRTAWECFINQFIFVRNLQNEVSIHQKFHKKTSILLEKLGCPISSWNEEPWNKLSFVNDLRNALVHYDSCPRFNGEAPKELYAKLEHCYSDFKYNANSENWIRVLLCPSIAEWACISVGESILFFENILKNRYKNPDITKTLLNHIFEDFWRANG
ncbi:MAG TPA: hypothetical protein PK961_01770 [bacterium]|nr:hypothetical protein [bacterium]